MQAQGEAAATIALKSSSKHRGGSRGVSEVSRNWSSISVHSQLA